MSFTMLRFERSAWPSHNRSNFSAPSEQWLSQPGFTANVSLTPRSGARQSFCSVRSWPCAPSPSPPLRRQRIFRVSHGPACQKVRSAISRSLSSLQSLRFAHQFNKSRAIAIRVCALSFLRPLQHSCKRSISLVFRIAQNHSKLSDGGDELQIRMRLCEIYPIISDTALEALHPPVAT